MFRPVGTSDVTFTGVGVGVGVGVVIDIIVRVLGPVLLALAVFAIRNRTKRWRVDINALRMRTLGEQRRNAARMDTLSPCRAAAVAI
ncbi:hypothetical protein Gbro_4707 [Gordonia bronchialis DSM 43247]|uniref:Uncharacterized protein n=1 Tax=Gordonia bronchialis (strain ATCC 25592 / DSM 43247 / BCRC 13721 / JCM 3198 / KCTC 3076 / NBRC 16047 / NCTC 10667) TaxID=526226 RepID=D0L880_GORB4|nr:hypothetical protein Gbro_4707 [Gordonia bronchialis DSM 43247]STQ66851.1 Uncharacterised protein [Gordonia bronchialis]